MKLEDIKEAIRAAALLPEEYRELIFWLNGILLANTEDLRRKTTD